MNDALLIAIFLFGVWVGINVDYLWNMYINRLDEHGRVDRED